MASSTSMQQEGLSSPTTMTTTTVSRSNTGGGVAPWRSRMAEILESSGSHITTLVLLLIHLVLTVLDLASFLTPPRSSSSCSNNNINHSGGGGEHHERPLFKWVEVAILALLTAKSAALAVALGKVFFTRLARVVDAAVVVVALVLELVLEGVTGGLVAVVRLWRVLKVVESGMGVRSEVVEERSAAMNAKVEELRREKLTLEVMVVERNRRISELQNKLDNFPASSAD